MLFLFKLCPASAIKKLLEQWTGQRRRIEPLCETSASAGLAKLVWLLDT